MHSKMATKVIVLLLHTLVLASEDDFRVSQPTLQLVRANDVATIVCECHEECKDFWMLKMKLTKGSENQWSCSVHNATTPHCSAKEESGKRTTFSLLNLRPNTSEVYFCEITRVKPTPVIKQKGTGTTLIIESECPIFTLWTWILIGVAALFCLCSILLACAYIKLKVLQSETDDSVTYVQMQRKKRDPDSNAEYVDMREVHPVGRGSTTDMNFNSQQYHCMTFTGQ